MVASWLEGRNKKKSSRVIVDAVLPSRQSSCTIYYDKLHGFVLPSSSFSPVPTHRHTTAPCCVSSRCSVLQCGQHCLPTSTTRPPTTMEARLPHAQEVNPKSSPAHRPPPEAVQGQARGLAFVISWPVEIEPAFMYRLIPHRTARGEVSCLHLHLRREVHQLLFKVP